MSNQDDILHDQEEHVHEEDSGSVEEQWAKQLGLDIVKPEETTKPDGTIEWLANGILHRDEEEGPARIAPNGRVEYWKYNVIHRSNGPAITRPDGYEAYFEYGKLHNDDGPALITATGRRQYYLNGVPHNEDGPALTFHDGEYYCQKGNFHTWDNARSNLFETAKAMLKKDVQNAEFIANCYKALGEETMYKKFLFIARMTFKAMADRTGN
jgi:hypothetical protein